MAAAPAAIGSRGTIGSLVRKEIDYFGKFESEQRRSSRKPQARIVEIPGHCRPKPGFWFLTMTWKKKKHKGKSISTSGGFFPSICSMVDVAETSHNYRILKDDDDAQNLLL